MKQVSSVAAAENAISGFKLQSYYPKKLSVAQSDVTSMKNGVLLGNNSYESAKDLNNRVVQVAKAVPAYARKIEESDKQDAHLLRKTLKPSELENIF